MRQPGARLQMESNYVRRDDAKWLFFTSAGEMLQLSQKCQAVAAFSALACRRRGSGVSSDRAVGEVEALCLMLLQTGSSLEYNSDDFYYLHSIGTSSCKMEVFNPSNADRGNLKKLKPFGH